MFMALFWIIVCVPIGIRCLFFLSLFSFSEPFSNHWSTFVIGNVKQYYNDQQEPLQSRSWNEIPSSNVYWELSCERRDGSRTGQGNSSTPGKIFNPMMGIWHLWRESGWRGSGIGKEVIWLQHTSDKVTANPIESFKIKISHSSILTWRIPWTEEPGRQQSMGLQRVRHDWACAHTHTHQALDSDHAQSRLEDSCPGRLCLSSKAKGRSWRC